MTIQLRRLVISIGRDRHGQPGVELSKVHPGFPVRCAVNSIVATSGPWVDVRFTRSEADTAIPWASIVVCWSK